ncbi:MAG: AbrB/MazE/SpoVT family DNA-binding domain-containing protein [Chloroflexi bacterium]|nr:AbrB/MazE/SpoVT family DNA-binding domain-containing protein [Chloroflexota bacterium]
MRRVKVNRRLQFTIPAEVGRQASISPGDYLRIEVRGSEVVLTPEAGSYSQRLHGLHKEIWERIDPQDYIQQERNAWQNSLLS